MKARKCWLYFQKIRCYCIVFFVTPMFFAFEVLIMRPKYLSLHQMGDVEHLIHLTIATFLFINVCGNMFLTLLTNTSMKGYKGYGTSYCEICDIKRPQGSWHCKTCNACIVGRDHHCSFFVRCVGLYNQRYYVLYLGYVSISMLYSSYFNFWYVNSMFQGYEIFISALMVISSHGVIYQYGYRDLYVLFLLMNLGLFVWMGILFAVHFNNVLKGVSARGSRGSNVIVCKEDWKKNIRKVFGEKWYWAILWPFAESPLPLNIID
ncbi:hypothetical protein K1T71_004771 [Dendrolimus kikuchii]|uniref:Uncharacterized protein n=1 Tax=Dendrolimus kikuchii TaxID=765133 RepID=A0ACC1D8J4_9NEOP|nr:hypothetical protein K1T71_004771 [Dendrolimus kikuchii]